MFSSLVTTVCNTLISLTPIDTFDSLIAQICSAIISTLASFGL